MLEHGDGDFVKIVSARLPMMTIWDMWGVPEDERAPLVNAVDKLVGYADPAVTEGRPAAEVMFENAMYLRDFGGEYAERRRAEPTEDLMSDLIRAEVDSAHLTTEEIQGFFVLLAIAGLDTTRHTTSHAMKALTDYPEQRDTLRGDLNGSLEAGVEEFVRWATPVMTFRRTATRDTHLGGQSIAAGDKVVLFYPSANRDEDAFDAPMEFNVSRTPNKHVGFGGGGPHFCLGNQLARTQLRALFSEILTRAPGLQAGDPEYLTSSFIHGVRRMPYQLNV
jgi:cytochrome P450